MVLEGERRGKIANIVKGHGAHHAEDECGGFSFPGQVFGADERQTIDSLSALCAVSDDP